MTFATDCWALREERIVVSKDEDLLFLADRGGNSGRLLWVRIGNCSRDAPPSAFERGMPALSAAFESGQRVVELASARCEGAVLPQDPPRAAEGVERGVGGGGGGAGGPECARASMPTPLARIRR
jgi:hypothetical protein